MQGACDFTNVKRLTPIIRTSRRNALEAILEAEKEQTDD